MAQTEQETDPALALNWPAGQDEHDVAPEMLL
jgi:hypothetical protein